MRSPKKANHASGPELPEIEGIEGRLVFLGRGGRDRVEARL